MKSKRTPYRGLKDAWLVSGESGEHADDKFSYLAYDVPEIVRRANTLLFANTLFESYILKLEPFGSKPRIFYAEPRPNPEAQWVLSIEYTDATVKRWEYSKAEDAIADLPKHITRKDICQVDLRHMKFWPADIDEEEGSTTENPEGGSSQDHHGGGMPPHSSN